MRASRLRRGLTAVVFLAGLLCLQADTGAAQSSASRDRLEALTSAWKDSTSAWAGESDATKQGRAARFLSGVPLGDLLAMCQEEIGDNREREQLIQGLLEAKLKLDPIALTDLLVLLTAEGVDPACQKPVVQQIAAIRETMTRPEREMAAEAFLRIADASDHDVVVRNQLEAAAAELSLSDALLDRMRTYLESTSEELRLQAFTMMAQSRDPRAADLMARALREYETKGEAPAGRVLVMVGIRMGREAYDLLTRFQRMTDDPGKVRAAEEAMAHTGDPRFMELLLERYDDERTGIRDATGQIYDRAERDHYYRLWHLTRVLEPTITTSFNGEDPELRRQALELIDRQSRFGIPAHPAEMADALRLARERARAAGDSAMLERLDQIGARFEALEREKFERGR